MAGYSLQVDLGFLKNLSMYNEYQGMDGLKQLLADISISVPTAAPNAVSLFYSGMLGDAHSSALAQAISASSGGSVIAVNQSLQ